MHTSRHFVSNAFEQLTHLVGRISRRHYFEDYVRVYPDVAFDRIGRRKTVTSLEHRNYLNHRKFYGFAAQFVAGKSVVDVGCGSGYGCAILKAGGASHVSGCDMSSHALTYARDHFAGAAEFTLQGITDLHDYTDGSFDVTISSEVLEHIKEYKLEHRAVEELRRITRPGGLVVLGTPNSELLGEHGFAFPEFHELIAGQFDSYLIFENALVPFGDQKNLWTERLASGMTGIIVSEDVNLDETVLPAQSAPELKVGLAPGLLTLDDVEIDTRLLHNTHSWICVAKT